MPKIAGRERRPLVLFRTSYFGKVPPTPPVGQVEWTADRKRLAQADIVIVHLPNWAAKRRIRKYPGQIWVAWSQESRVNYPMMDDPAFMAQFDLQMTHEASADVWAPYLPTLAEWARIAAVPVAKLEEAAPVVAFISSTTDRSGRTALLQQLFRFVEIDSYGRLFNNRQLASGDEGGTSKLRTVARYPFCVAFENSISPDYVTEKVFDALRAGSIPIYLGAPNIAAFVPAGSYIDAANFGGARELGTYLRYLVAHPAEAARYHAWRSQPMPGALLERSASVEHEPFERLLELCRARRGNTPTRRELGPVQRLIDEVLVRVWRRPRRVPVP